MKHILFTALIVAMSTAVFSQNVGVNTTNPDASAALHIAGSDKGMLIPTVALTGSNDVSTVTAAPYPTGLMVYNTASITGGNAVTPGFYYWDGSKWSRFIVGNEGADNLGNHMATQNLLMGSNRIGIGVSPATNLHIKTTSSVGMYIERTSGYPSIEAYGTDGWLMLEGQRSLNGNVGVNYYGSGNIILGYGSGSGGNVGVGTNAPSERLDVLGNTRSYGSAYALELDPNVSGPRMYFGSTTDEDAFMTIGAYSGINNIDNTTRDMHIFGSGVSAGLYYKSNGDVGVGTTAPTEKLHINGNVLVQDGGYITGSARNLKLLGGNTADDTNFEWVGFYSGTTRQGIILYDGAWGNANSLTNEFSITAENSNLLTLNTLNNMDILVMPDGTGNVGIATTAPTEKLTVNGNIRIAEGGYIDDDATAMGNSDDWIHLNGYIELKSNTDSYGIVLRDKDNTEYFGITQKDGYSYLADSGPSTSYFLRGNTNDVEVADQLLVGSLSGSGIRNVEVDATGTLVAGKSSAYDKVSVATNFHPSYDDFTYTSVLSSCSDDALYTINWGFPITIDGVAYTEGRISTNGVLFFGTSGSTSFGNGALPTSITSNPALFFMWDDHSGFDITYRVAGTTGGRVCHIRWRADETTNCSGDDMNIYITLYEGSNSVSVRYMDIAGGSSNYTAGYSATIGFQFAGGSSAEAIMMSQNTEVLDDNNERQFFNLTFKK